MEKLNAINGAICERKKREADMHRISVVDDDAPVGQAISLWLRHHGFRVSSADSGFSGLPALDNATFDLMIVDVFMPAGRGLEAIDLFRQPAPNIPLVASPGPAMRIGRRVS